MGQFIVQVILGFSFTWMIVSGRTLSDEMLSLVRRRLDDASKLSWEIGTRAQTLLDLDAPDFSVLTPGVQQPPPSFLLSPVPAEYSKLLTTSSQIVAIRMAL